MNISVNTQRSIPYLIGLIIFVYLTKPQLFFKSNNQPREYGIGTDNDGYKKTLYTFQFFVLISAILIFYYFKE